MRGLCLILLWIGLAGPVAASEAQWITSGNGAAPAVVHFRRDIDLTRVDAPVWIDVSADNRFILYVNGQRAAAGPATSDPAHWRHARIDIAPYLKTGRNQVAAVVWNFVIPGTDDLNTQIGPLAQSSDGLGFYLKAEDDDFTALSTGSDWLSKADMGHTAQSAFAQLNGKGWFGYYVAGAPETIDASRSDWKWQAGPLDGWTPALLAKSRSTTADPLPQMTYEAVPAGEVVRGGTDLPVTVPANSHVKLLIRRDDMVSAYPQLSVSDGQGAVIRLTYAEALYDKDGHKGIRDEIGERTARGLTDTFIADGRARTFETLHWRVWRFIEIDVTTGDAPLRLEALTAYESRYPFVARGSFRSSDAELNAIWDIGLRTAFLDAHESYMDSAYWEQLQYVGDTRLQMLISYAVTGDRRLAVNAIDAFGWSDAEGGLTEGAYPSRGHNPIAPFSLLWIGMMADYRLNQPDTDVVVRNLPRMRQVLAWFRPYVHDDGLLGKNPTWNFVDWVGKARDAFPSFDGNDESCLTSLIYLGALQQASALERELGDSTQGEADTALAEMIRAGVRAHCWDEGRRLFADDPSKTLFSQQTNALAVLYDVAPKDRQADILTRITAHGIEPAGDLIPVSYYFSWYLVRAYEHAGLSDRYIALLQTWRDLLPLHFSTWPEAKLEARSDSHAWSGHPTADLLAIVAGIQSAGPGYQRVRIAPHLGTLKELSATAETPSGPVIVHYQRTESGLMAEIDLPSGLPGEFVWQGKTWPLKAGRNSLKL